MFGQQQPRPAFGGPPQQMQVGNALYSALAGGRQQQQGGYGPQYQQAYNQQQQQQQQQLQGYANPGQLGGARGYQTPGADRQSMLNAPNRALGNRTMQMGAQQLLDAVAGRPASGWQPGGYTPSREQYLAQQNAAMAANTPEARMAAWQSDARRTHGGSGVGRINDMIGSAEQRIQMGQGTAEDQQLLEQYGVAAPQLPPNYGTTEYGTASYGNPRPGGYGPGGQPQYNPDGSQGYRNMQGYNEFLRNYVNR